MSFEPFDIVGERHDNPRSTTRVFHMVCKARLLKDLKMAIKLYKLSFVYCPLLGIQDPSSIINLLKDPTFPGSLLTRTNWSTCCGPLTGPVFDGWKCK